MTGKRRCGCSCVVWFCSGIVCCWVRDWIARFGLDDDKAVRFAQSSPLSSSSLVKLGGQDAERALGCIVSALLCLIQANEQKCGELFETPLRWKMFYANTVHNHSSGGKFMAKCPNCGNDVKNAKKTWKMAGKPDKAGKRTQLTIGLYECCGKTFRQVLDKKKI